MNPGSTVPPCASMTLVAAPARRFMSRFEPTRRISLPRTASASAGSWPAPVNTRPLSTTRSTGADRSSRCAPTTRPAMKVAATTAMTMNAGRRDLTAPPYPCAGPALAAGAQRPLPGGTGFYLRGAPGLQWSI